MSRIVQILLCGALALTVSCGDTPWKRLARGYRTVRLTKTLAENFDAALKQAASSTHAKCLDAHGAKTAEFDKCILPVLRILRAWTGWKAGKPTGKGVLPALQAAQKATKLGLDAAYDYIENNKKACDAKNAPKQCRADWEAGLKPALCGTWTLIAAAVKIGAYKATSNKAFLTVRALVEAFACN